MKFTHLDKIYWEKGKITKGEVIAYYKKIAKKILPYLKGRPLVMHRFPNGVLEKGFYQKQAPENLPSFVKTASVQHKGRKITYIVVENTKTLLYVANLGSIELHPFSANVKQLDRPDYLAFDLDPEGISFDYVVDTALALYDLLSRLKVASYCKTTGGRGLHIFVPLKGKYTYQEAKKFARLIAEKVHQMHPTFTSLERSPKKRGKKVYIDYLQNAKSQTLVAPYSIRARETPTVSMPLSWEEVKKGLDPKKFTIDSALRRGEKGEEFKKVLGKGVDLKAALKRFNGAD